MYLYGCDLYDFQEMIFVERGNTLICYIILVGTIYFDDINLTNSCCPLKRYAQSKTANILFTRELARRLKGKRTEHQRRYDIAIELRQIN